MGEGGEDGSARMLSLSPTLAQTGRRKLLFEGFRLFSVTRRSRSDSVTESLSDSKNRVD